MYIHRRRKQGVSKGGAPLWLWVSNRGEQHPCWHTTLLAKYSVLYLCFRLTPGRDWLRYLLCGQIAVDKHFSAAVGQADFVRTRTKSGFAHRAKSACPEKEAEVYQLPSRRSDSTLVSSFPPWISRGFCRHYIDSYTGHCKMQRWSDCPGTPSGSAYTIAGAAHRPPA